MSASRTFLSIMLFLMSCGSGKGFDGPCPDRLLPSDHWAEAYRVRVECITGVPYDGGAPRFGYADLDGGLGGVYSNDCGIIISEKRRVTPYDPTLGMRTYIHEGCHLLGLDDEHKDSEWLDCTCY